MNRGMILPDFLVRRPEGGYYCRYGGFFIDPKYPVDTALVSHAHGDHATPGHQRVYGTAATIAFMKHRFKRQNPDGFREVGFRETFSVGGVAVSFIPAGHILGSAQILMEYDGVRYLYTGDYKLQADATCEALEVVQADVLITESTFANPDVEHPDPIAEIKKLNQTSHNVLLGTYALGKAQRLTQLINQHCPDKEVLVHHTILPVHRIYEQLGHIQLHYQPYDRKAMRPPSQNKIYMVPPMTFNSYYRATNVLRAFASGWQRLHRQNDLELYISDHVDWVDILQFVSQVNPGEIWTVHGDGRYLKAHFAGIIEVRDLQATD